MAQTVVIGTGSAGLPWSESVTTVGYSDSRDVTDGRNVLDRDAWQAAGFTYKGVGR
jgi:hypothetical protein